MGGFISPSVFLGIIVSMRDQVARIPTVNSSALGSPLEAHDLVRVWSEHERLLTTSGLRRKRKLAFGTAIALFTLGIVLLFLGK